MPSGSAPRPSSTINSVGSLKPIAGFPTFDDAAHDFGRKAAADGETDPDSWTAVGGIGGGHGNADNTTYAYAICTGDRVNASGMTTRVHQATEPPRPRTGQPPSTPADRLRRTPAPTSGHSA